MERAWVPGQGHVQWLLVPTRLGPSTAAEQGTGLQGQPASMSTAGSTALSPQPPWDTRADLSPSPKDEEREPGRGQVTRKLETARGQRRAWVEGQRRAESKGRTSTGRGPGGQSASRGELPGGHGGTWQVQGGELSPGNKGVKTGAGLE